MASGTVGRGKAPLIAQDNAGPSRQPARAPAKPRSVERDIWGLGLSSDLPPSDRPTYLRRRSGPSTDQHPLYRKDSPPQAAEGFVEVLGDVSRPNLRRLTSDLERRAGSGHGSEDGSCRGSMDKLRMTSGESQEVEVLIHQVQPNQSLAGIALLYGIDLATLRKTNKLWPSDPVHLRRHLYVPLEACRWNKASETLTRGPGEGQVTLSPKPAGKGKAREENLIDLDTASENEVPLDGTPPQSPGLDAWGSFSPVAEAKLLVDHPPPLDSSHTRTVDIVRIPSSQLKFFPKPPRPPESSRTSIDFGPDAVPPPPLSIQNDLHFSHHPAIPRKSSLTSMVKLRPPTSAPSTGTGLADRLSNLFFIPPPPPGGLILPPRNRPRISLDSAMSSPGRSMTGSPVLAPSRPTEEVEMMSRIKNGGGRRKLD